MFSCNQHGTFTFFNKKFQESLNYSNGEMLQISILDIVREEFEEY